MCGNDDPAHEIEHWLGQYFTNVCDGRSFLVSSERVQFDVMISRDLLEILVCPMCKKPLTLKPNGESLKCGECRRVYPIRDEIPILLVDEATTEES